MCGSEKKTECRKVHMTERMALDLARAANEDGRSDSEFINRVLSLYLYGHLKSAAETSEGPNRA